MFLAEFAQGIREGLKETLGTMNRSRMIMLAIIVAITLFVIVYLPYSLRDDSDNVTATCTVTKAYTKDRGGSDVSGMTNIAPVGIFETKECGTLRLSTAPSGWKIPEYVQTAQVGKKYLFHVANDSAQKERDFDTTRFEEIKE